MKAEKRIIELGYQLPIPPKPVAAYVPFRISGNILFVSGTDCRINGELQYSGKLGKEVSIEQGYAASRTAVLNSLAIIKTAIGDLDKIKQIVSLKGYVNSADGFMEQPYVVNGASEFLIAVFGEYGKHQRCALGANELPFNTCIEIELIVEITE
jgi:enamine deaminase RidA (YjgF/YER057c/UK114 family)